MADTPYSANKTYDDVPFILTDRKLSRIVEVARERLGRVKNDHDYKEVIEAGFKNGKQLIVDSLENVLALDNSTRNPITSLELTFSMLSEKTSTAHNLNIRFTGNRSYRDEIRVNGFSTDLGWLQETLGALEEQVERTIAHEWAYSIHRNGTLLLAISLLVVFTVLASAPIQTAGPLKLPVSRVEQLVTMSSSAKSETEKIDFVFQYLSATLEKDTTSETVRRLSRNPRTYFIGVPTIIAVLSAIAAVLWFYPRNVFAWGDRGEAYETTVERRKFLWSGVVLALVIGVLGNLFVVGATT